MSMSRRSSLNLFNVTPLSTAEWNDMGALNTSVYGHFANGSFTYRDTVSSNAPWKKIPHLLITTTISSLMACQVCSHDERMGNLPDAHRSSKDRTDT